MLFVPCIPGSQPPEPPPVTTAFRYTILSCLIVRSMAPS